MKQLKMIPLFFALAFLLSQEFAFAATIEVPLVVTSGAQSYTLRFGVAPWMHFCWDLADTLNGHQEMELPPPPPPGIMWARFVNPREFSPFDCFALGTFDDYRPFINTSQRDTFKVVAQPGDSPLAASWPANLFSNFGEARLVYITNSLQLVTIDMLTDSSVDLSDSQNGEFQIYTAGPGGFSQGIVQDWNMVSVPVTLTDYRTTIIYPSAISGAYAFDPLVGYRLKDTLKNGAGYWLKFGSSHTISILGLPRGVDTVVVSDGWNMIGSITQPVASDSIVQIPSGIVASNYYAYTGTYTTADTLFPGRAYWVKVNASGVLVLRP